MIEFTRTLGLWTSTRRSGLTKLGRRKVLQKALDLTGLLGTLQADLNTTLYSPGLLETLKIGSQAALYFTDLLGTFQTGLLAKSTLMKLR